MKATYKYNVQQNSYTKVADKNGKALPKYEIIKVIKRHNLTELCEVFVKCTGERIKDGKHGCFQVSKFFEPFAQNWHQERAVFFTLCKLGNKTGGHFEVDMGERAYWVNFLKEEIKEGLNNYTKVPILGHTHLYFCSPVYGHSDYNKCCAMPIKGNEIFINALIKYAKKHLAY